MNVRMLLRALFVVFLMGQPVHAQNPEEIPCLDTLAITSPQILIGTIVDIKDLRTRKSGSEVEVMVDRQLKGVRLPPRITIDLEGVAKPTLEGWRNDNTRILFFFGFSRDATIRRYGPNAIGLSASSLKVLTADMRVLTDPADVVRAVESAIQSHPVGNAVTIVTFWLTDGAARSLGHVDQRHCYCITSVPVDKGLEQLARNELGSSSAMERWNGATLLASFPTSANVELLKPLLNDPAMSPFHYYSVRMAAYDALTKMGITVREPVLRETKTAK